MKGSCESTRVLWMGLALSFGLGLGAPAARAERAEGAQRAAAIGDVAATDSDGLTFPEVPISMVWIPAGNVRLGQPGVAEPVHDVYIEGFWIGVREVSNAEYQVFIDAGGYTNPAWWNPVGWEWKVAEGITRPKAWLGNHIHAGGTPGDEDFPVVGVSWWEADAYCRWAGGRLPTEAEWEKAAKGGCEVHGDPEQCDDSDSPSYPWGEGISGPRANYLNSGDPYEYDGRSTPAGYYDGAVHGGYQTQDSPSPYGLYDVAGNLWEWCSTRYAPYPYNPSDGREEPPTTPYQCCRILRGGSDAAPTRWLRCAHRYMIGSVNTQSLEAGFRCARSE